MNLSRKNLILFVNFTLDGKNLQSNCVSYTEKCELVLTLEWKVG